MAAANIFKAPNNDGSGRSDYHVAIEGESHSATFGPFRSRQNAEQVAAKHLSNSYWDTGEGYY